MAPLISYPRNSALTDKPGPVHAKPAKTRRAWEHRNDEYEDRADSDWPNDSDSEMSDREQVSNVTDSASIGMPPPVQQGSQSQFQRNQQQKANHNQRSSEWSSRALSSARRTRMIADAFRGSPLTALAPYTSIITTRNTSPDPILTPERLASLAARRRRSILNERRVGLSASFSPYSFPTSTRYTSPDPIPTPENLASLAARRGRSISKERRVNTSPTSTRNTSPDPDPIPTPFLPRVRRGYWNRRGDHLMPDGHIVYAPLALAYPMELTEYPLEEDGYQNEEGAFIQYAERPELSASLSLKGRAPEKPYETFVVYVNNNSRRPSSPPIDSSPCDIKKVDEGGSPSKDLPRVSDPWDLTRLAAFNSRPPKSPTSSSSSYGSAHSTHSRASSFSGTAEGHIPGTNRDVLEFPFGYPIP